MPRHLTSLDDLTSAELKDILNISAELKQKYKAGERPVLYPGRVLAQLFEKPSLRTRNSFEAAMINLGGSGEEKNLANTIRMRVLWGNFVALF